MTIHSGRKVRTLEEEEEREIMPSLCLQPKGSARTPLGPIIGTNKDYEHYEHIVRNIFLNVRNYG